jgi:2-polyprenyl-6-methoxyphenol hydroxylase-like FAD-dependent oxidoreductase
MLPEAAVLVVGAGPTGLLLAAELCRRGVSCRVIDSHPAALHWDRATVVHPRSLEVFESLGIVEPLLAKGVKQRIARVHSAGRVLGEIDLALCGSRYPFNIGISEEVTESILNEYLQSQGGQVVRASKLVELAPYADGLLATIDHAGSVEKISVSWVVGCDGVHSTTRTLSGIELAGHDITEPWAVFDATLSGWSDSFEANYAYLDEITVIITSLPNNRWRVYLRPSSAESNLESDALATLRRYLPKVGFRDVANPTRFHCHTKVAKRYRAGRVLLAGDAAHVCSPSQGHGMNSGLQDAFNLAWKLALVCEGHCTADLLDSYEAERRPVAEKITASGDEFERAQDLTKPNERRARDKSLRAAFLDPKSRHHESIAEAELDIDYTGSPIVMGDHHESLAPGQRLPDTIAVTHPTGQPGLLHELTHRAGHTALLIGAPSAPGDQLAELETALRTQTSSTLVESTSALSAQSALSPGERAGVRGAFELAHITPAAADQLGIRDITLLVIRPDGHIGLRADRNHATALAAYPGRLTSGQG